MTFDDSQHNVNVSHDLSSPKPDVTPSSPMSLPLVTIENASPIASNSQPRSRSTSRVRLNTEFDKVDGSSGSNQAVSSTLTIHQNPNWLKDLKTNFRAEIIEVCSAKVTNAVKFNEYIVVSKGNVEKIINMLISGR